MTAPMQSTIGPSIEASRHAVPRAPPDATIKALIDAAMDAPLGAAMQVLAESLANALADATLKPGIEPAIEAPAKGPIGISVETTRRMGAAERSAVEPAAVEARPVVLMSEPLALQAPVVAEVVAESPVPLEVRLAIRHRAHVTIEVPISVGRVADGDAQDGAARDGRGRHRPNGEQTGGDGGGELHHGNVSLACSCVSPSKA
ncbi:MAG: hypothetical protein AAGK04_00485 [Planctomycetota bacterium]